MKTTVKDRQTLADIGLIGGGTLTEGLETAIRNGLSASAELADGQELETAEATGGTERRSGGLCDAMRWKEWHRRPRRATRIGLLALTAA